MRARRSPQTPPVGLGAADSFAVLAGASVTNTGPSVIDGDLGVTPATAVSGFPPGIVTGTIHAADAVALQAQTTSPPTTTPRDGPRPPTSRGTSAA